RGLKMAGKSGRTKRYPDLRYKFIRSLISLEHWQRQRQYLKQAADWTSKAIVSLDLHGESVKSIKQASQLEGIGRLIGSRLKDHETAETYSLEPPAIGKCASSASAILVAIINKQDEMVAQGANAGDKLCIEEDVIKDTAAQMCEETFIDTSTNNAFCPAWQRITALVSRGFVKKRQMNRKPVYQLLPLGEDLAKRLRDKINAQTDTKPPSTAQRKTPASKPKPKESVNASATKPKRGRPKPDDIKVPTARERDEEALYTNDKGEDGIVLIVDTQEWGGDNVGLGELIRLLQQQGIVYKTKRLKCGDYNWIWRCAGEERTLPLVIERKRADDLAKSLKDGRYHKQKENMISWKMKFFEKGINASLKYVVEGDPKAYVVRCSDGCGSLIKCGYPTVEQVEMTIHELEKDDDFQVLRTASIIGTVQVLTDITGELSRRLNMGHFDCLIQYDDIPSTVDVPLKPAANTLDSKVEKHLTTKMQGKQEMVDLTEDSQENYKISKPEGTVIVKDIHKNVDAERTVNIQNNSGLPHLPHNKGYHPQTNSGFTHNATITADDTHYHAPIAQAHSSFGTSIVHPDPFKVTYPCSPAKKSTLTHINATHTPPKKCQNVRNNKMATFNERVFDYGAEKEDSLATDDSQDLVLFDRDIHTPIASKGKAKELHYAKSNSEIKNTEIIPDESDTSQEIQTYDMPKRKPIESSKIKDREIGDDFPLILDDVEDANALEDPTRTSQIKNKINQKTKLNVPENKRISSSNITENNVQYTSNLDLEYLNPQPSTSTMQPYELQHVNPKADIYHKSTLISTSQKRKRPSVMLHNFDSESDDDNHATFNLEVPKALVDDDCPSPKKRQRKTKSRLKSKSASVHDRPDIDMEVSQANPMHSSSTFHIRSKSPKEQDILPKRFSPLLDSPSSTESPSPPPPMPLPSKQRGKVYQMCSPKKLFKSPTKEFGNLCKASVHLECKFHETENKQTKCPPPTSRSAVFPQDSENDEEFDILNEASEHLKQKLYEMKNKQTKHLPLTTTLSTDKDEEFKHLNKASIHLKQKLAESIDTVKNKHYFTNNATAQAADVKETDEARVQVNKLHVDLRSSDNDENCIVLDDSQSQDDQKSQDYPMSLDNPSKSSSDRQLLLEHSQTPDNGNLPYKEDILKDSLKDPIPNDHSSEKEDQTPMFSDLSQSQNDFYVEMPSMDMCDSQSYTPNRDCSEQNETSLILKSKNNDHSTTKDTSAGVIDEVVDNSQSEPSFEEPYKNLQLVKFPQSKAKDLRKHPLHESETEDSFEESQVFGSVKPFMATHENTFEDEKLDLNDNHTDMCDNIDKHLDDTMSDLHNDPDCCAIQEDSEASQSLLSSPSLKSISVPSKTEVKTVKKMTPLTNSKQSTVKSPDLNQSTQVPNKIEQSTESSLQIKQATELSLEIKQSTDKQSKTSKSTEATTKTKQSIEQLSETKQSTETCQSIVFTLNDSQESLPDINSQSIDDSESFELDKPNTIPGDDHKSDGVIENTLVQSSTKLEHNIVQTSAQVGHHRNRDNLDLRARSSPHEYTSLKSKTENLDRTFLESENKRLTPEGENTRIGRIKQRKRNISMQQKNNVEIIKSVLPHITEQKIIRKLELHKNNVEQVITLLLDDSQNLDTQSQNLDTLSQNLDMESQNLDLQSQQEECIDLTDSVPV
ncbi:unnamed protein product, partial [Owenia fusiformis]